MQPDLRHSSHHDVASPEPFFQTAVEALRHGAFLVACRLMGSQRDNLFPPAIFCDDGNVPQTAAHLVNRFGVVSRIHHIIQVIDALAGHFHQRHGHLTLMEGGRGQHRADGQAAVVDIHMQLVAYPGLLITLGVLVRPHVTVHRQLCQGLRHCLSTLALQTRSLVSGLAPPPAAAGLFSGAPAWGASASR